jgi:hypothetical protein
MTKLMVFPGFCQAMFPFVKAYWLIESQAAKAFPEKDVFKIKIAAFCKATFAGVQDDVSALQFADELLSDLDVELAKEGAITAELLSEKTPQQARFIVDELLKEKWGA